MKDQYVLRERDDDEIFRLAFQHKVWQNTSDFALKKARIQSEDQIIDLGSGPGYLSEDIATYLNQKGKIYCVDNSEKFIRFIEHKKKDQLKPLQLDIREGIKSVFQEGSIDKIFCRWVLMFNDRIDHIIEQVYDTLKEGGKFISIEYFNFQQIGLFPDAPIFNKVYEKVEELLISNGGNPNIGGSLYAILQERGFKNVEVYPIFETGKVNSPFWEWLEKTNENHVNLVSAGLITPAELEHYHEIWRQRTENPISFITAPPLMITIGEK